MKIIVRNLLYILIFTSFFGAQFFTIDFMQFKLSLFRIDLILILLILFSSFKHYKILVFKKSKFVSDFSISVFIFILIYSIFSLLWVKDISLWTRAFYFITSGIVSMVLIYFLFNNINQILISLVLVFIILVIHNIIGWYEVITSNYLFIDNYNQIYYSSIQSRIPISFAGNPNDYALFLNFGIGTAIILFKAKKSALFKFLIILVLISSIILLFLTLSRANILGFLFGLFVLLIVNIKNGRIITKTTLVILSFAIIFYLFTSELIQNYLSSILHFDFIQGSSELNRLGLIKNGLYFLKETFGFGTGLGNIEYWMSHSSIYETGGALNIHNWWMEILVQFGIGIFLLYIAFYINLLLTFLKSLRRKSVLLETHISSGFVFILSAFLIASISSSSNLYIEWLWIYWGIMVAFQKYITIHNGSIRKVSY
ncbi:MAG: O-antigen ligase family protein [Bacilli bacterium]|nr:O-antigen ligase family protein [Bacilli bacterium]